MPDHNVLSRVRLMRRVVCVVVMNRVELCGVHCRRVKWKRRG